MAKTTDRPLMRQKVRVTTELLQKWEINFLFHNRQIMTPSLMKADDLGTTFKHQDRVFEIVGMGESDSIMLRETREEGIFYWECMRRFVQYKLQRFNRAFKKLPNGKTHLVDIPYDEIQMLLAPKGRKRGKKKEDEEETTENEEFLVNKFEKIEDYENQIEDTSQTT